MQNLDREELRIALVMNGGVSLAVWIGGLTHEVNRVVRCEGAYDALLDLLQLQPRVDVISGTSAGGINGALLALALVRNQSLDLLEDLWVEKAALDMLLRDPLEPLPTSLLRGDDYFLRELKQAFLQLNAGGDPADPSAVPLDLTLTTTLLAGEPVELSDDFGRAISDVKHTARFRFRRGVDEDDDAFARADVADRLALAARCTASFPVAFEPSFVPVNPETPVAGRPDLKSEASFRSSRFVIDGGVLDNKPLGPAIEAIVRQRIEGDVRRVLMYVVPDPGESGADEAARADAAPSATHVAVMSLLHIPRVEPVAAEIQGIRYRNRRVMEERESRAMLTNLLTPEQIQELSRTLFPMYQDRRTKPAISGIVSQLADGLAEIAAASRQAAKQGNADVQPRLWLERQTHRAWLAEAFGHAALPWVPTTYPEAMEQGGVPAELQAATWRWGIRAVEHAASTMLDVLRRTQRVVPLGHAARETLPVLWRRAYDIMARLRRVRRNDEGYWRKTASSLAEWLMSQQQPGVQAQPATLEAWVAVRLAEWSRRVYTDPRHPAKGAGGAAPTVPEAMGGVAHEIAALLHENAALVREVAEVARQSQIESDRVAGKELSRLAEYLMPKAAATPDAVLLRLSWLELVQYSLGSSTDYPDQYVELIQVSGNTPSAFGGRDRAAEKLAGVQLGHFGAFYKRAWRANDWMYGRLDGAANLVQVILSPDRLRRMALQWPAAAGQTRAMQARDAIRRIAVDEAPPDAQAALRGRFPESSLLRELAFLDSPDSPAPDSLPLCVDAVSRRIQLAIMEETLPTVANAVEADEQDKGFAPGAGARLLRAVRQAPRDSNGRLRPADALRIFLLHNVGQEKIVDQLGSDLFSMTSAQALAVLSSVGYREGQGLGAAKQLLRIVRAVALTFYLMIRNVTRRSQTGALLNGAALAMGATILGLALVGAKEIPAAAVTLGWVLVGGGILLALFRWYTAVVVAVGGAIVAWLLRGQIARVAPWLTSDRWGPPLAIGALAGLLLLFGSIRRPRVLTRWKYAREARRQKRAELPRTR